LKTAKGNPEKKDTIEKKTVKWQTKPSIKIGGKIYPPGKKGGAVTNKRGGERKTKSLKFKIKRNQIVEEKGGAKKTTRTGFHSNRARSEKPFNCTIETRFQINKDGKRKTDNRAGERPAYRGRTFKTRGRNRRLCRGKTQRGVAPQAQKKGKFIVAPGHNPPTVTDN